MKRLADQTLYEILEVPQDAAPQMIEAAYDRARSLYGPGSLATYTLMSSEEAALLTSRIEEAKQTLLDPEARTRYDDAIAIAGGADARPPPSGANGSVAPPFGAVPPVIPAIQPAPPPPVATPPPLPETAPPVMLLQEAASAAPSVPTRPAPIRLEREVTPVPATPPVAQADVPMPEGALWTGEALRRVREARGITIQQIADRTKVTRHHVENIEAERFAALPAQVYLRGILLSLARELRLDGQKVARAYLERAGLASTGQAGGRQGR